MNITLKGTVGGQVTFNCQTYGRIPIPKVQRSLSRDCITGRLVVTEFFNKLTITISDWQPKTIYDSIVNILTSNNVITYSDDDYTEKSMTLVPGSLVPEAVEDPECRFKFQLEEI